MAKNSSNSLADQLKPFVAPFRYDGDGEFHLKSFKTAEKGGLDKEKGERIIAANRKRLSDFQEKLYAQDRWSLLLIWFVAMLAAGVISSVTGGIAGYATLTGADILPTQLISVATSGILSVLANIFTAAIYVTLRESKDRLSPDSAASVFE